MSETSDELNQDYRDLLQCLCSEVVDFLVVGAYAVAFHGTPRATGDIDLLVRPTVENAGRVWRALVKFGAPLAEVGMTAADFATPGMVYQIGLPPRRIDILTEISGVTFDEAWASRVQTLVIGLPVAFIGRDALVKNKRATGRAKDLIDLDLLRAERSREDA
jgi:hypothetical protein